MSSNQQDSSASSDGKTQMKIKLDVDVVGKRGMGDTLVNGPTGKKKPSSPAMMMPKQPQQPDAQDEVTLDMAVRSTASYASIKTGGFDVDSIPSGPLATAEQLTPSLVVHGGKMQKQKPPSQVMTSSVIKSGKAKPKPKTDLTTRPGYLLWSQAKSETCPFYRMPKYSSPNDTSSLDGTFDDVHFVPLVSSTLVPISPATPQDGTVGTLTLVNLLNGTLATLEVRLANGRLGVQTSFKILGAAGLKAAIGPAPRGLSIQAMLAGNQSRVIHQLTLFDEHFAGLLKFTGYPMAPIVDDQLIHLGERIEAVKGTHDPGAKRAPMSYRRAMAKTTMDHSDQGPQVTGLMAPQDSSPFELPPMPARIPLPPMPPGPWSHLDVARHLDQGSQDTGAMAPQDPSPFQLPPMPARMPLPRMPYGPWIHLEVIDRGFPIGARLDPSMLQALMERRRGRGRGRGRH